MVAAGRLHQTVNLDFDKGHRGFDSLHSHQKKRKCAVELFKALCEKGICVSFAEAKRRVMSKTISVNGSPATMETTVQKGDIIRVKKGTEVQY